MPGPPPPPPGRFGIIPAALGNAFVGVSFSSLMQAVNGVPPYVGWFIGEIDPDSGWLGIDASTGQLFGTPIVVESDQVAIGVFDSALPTPNFAQIILPLDVLPQAAAEVPDYTALITSEHQSASNFMATVALLTNGVALITAAADTIPGAFNVLTAVGAQLDVIGLWVGASRNLALTLGFFGFNDTPGGAVFGELGNLSIGGRFYDLGDNFTSNALLSDVEYRQVILAKIITNQATGTITDLENALAALIGPGAIISDPGNLSINITIPSNIVTATQQALLALDILPRPAGVSINITYGLVIQPPAAALGLVGLAPTVAGSAALSPKIFPATGSLSLTGKAPTVGSHSPITSAAGALALTGYAPTVTVSSSPPGQTIKWVPGHHMSTNTVMYGTGNGTPTPLPNAGLQAVLADLNKYPGPGGQILIRGARFYMTWASIEIAQGVYDFALLDWLISQTTAVLGSAAVITVDILIGPFNADAPDPSWFPAYISGGSAATYGVGASDLPGAVGVAGAASAGYCVNVCNTGCNNRLIAMVAALGARYDGNANFECIQFQEDSSYVARIQAGGSYDETTYINNTEAMLSVAVASFPRTNVNMQHTWTEFVTPSQYMTAWMVANRVTEGSADTVGQSAFNLGYANPSTGGLAWGLMAMEGIQASGSTWPPVDQRPLGTSMLDVEATDMAGWYFSSWSANPNTFTGFQPLDLIAAFNNNYWASHIYWEHLFGNEATWPGPAGTVDQNSPWAAWPNLAPVLNNPANALTHVSYPANYPQTGPNTIVPPAGSLSLTGYVPTGAGGQATISFFGYGATPTDNAAGGNGGNGVTFTPPAGMSKGQLVVAYLISDTGTSGGIQPNGNDGQTWIAGATSAGNANTQGPVTYMYWCVFNGAWTNNPGFSQSGPSTQVTGGAMLVFSPTIGTPTWSIAVAEQIAPYNAPASAPAPITIAGQTPVKNSTITIAMWDTPIAITWALQTAGWAQPGGNAQFRNSTVNDSISLSVAYKAQYSAAATGAVINDQEQFLASYQHGWTDIVTFTDGAP